jgi:ketose-bisphosphate aldolase
MLVTSKEMLLKAEKNNYAVIQADYMDYDTAKVFCKIAEEKKLPIILAYAEVFEDILSLEEASDIGKYWANKVNAPVCLHLDHGLTVESCKKACDLGFSSVMIDSSEKSFEENVADTKAVVEYAHSKGIVVEAEIGHVGQTSDSDADIYTEVESAKRFVELTNVDSLAISIGTSHGNYKGKPKLKFERLVELKEALNIPLVLHGGSSTGDDNLNRCAREGISKINIFTDFMNAGLKSSKENEAKDYFELRNYVNQEIGSVLINYLQVFMTKGE